ncbi:hypothetical protein ACHAPU_011461 [Fusarium lateritium]
MATSIEAPDLDVWGLGQVRSSRKKKTKKGVRIHTLPIPPPPPVEQDAWVSEAPVEKASYNNDDIPCEPEATTEYGLSARDPEPCAACDIPAPEAKEELTIEEPDECEATKEAILETSDWDFMATEELSVDEAPTEGRFWPEEDSAAAETEPTKEYKELAEEARPMDEEENGEPKPDNGYM